MFFTGKYKILLATNGQHSLRKHAHCLVTSRGAICANVMYDVMIEKSVPAVRLGSNPDELRAERNGGVLLLLSNLTALDRRRIQAGNLE